MVSLFWTHFAYANDLILVSLYRRVKEEIQRYPNHITASHIQLNFNAMRHALIYSSQRQNELGTKHSQTWSKKILFHWFLLYFCIITILMHARTWFTLIKYRIKAELFPSLRLTVGSRFQHGLLWYVGIIIRLLRGRNGWISGIRPTGALIIHVSAREHVAGARHSTGHAMNICLIFSIKGRPVYSSHFRRADLGLLCNIQRGVIVSP